MKRVYLLFIMCSLALGSWAQTQQGYVKTLGRPDKKGQALSGVSVRVKGGHNAVLSKSDGTFSMLMTGKKNGDAYSLQQVQKTGYELNESGVIGRLYAFSDKVPLTIVMVSSTQIQADKQRIENNAYKVAERNYHAKMAQLEKDRETGGITAEQYRIQIRDMQDKFEKYQSLINDLANHYAHTDYDGLGEKEREINICIENGDLGRADSLINTIFDPVDVLKRNKEALNRIDQNMQQARDIMAHANAEMAAVLKQQEKDAEHLYQLYTISLARFDSEKACKYIGIRAELDTTNVYWQIDAGRFMADVGDYNKAMMFNQRAKHVCKDYGIYGSILNNIGDVLKTRGKYDEALSYFEKAKDWDIKMFGPDNEVLAKVYNNIALIYNEMEKYPESLENYNKAIEIESKFRPEGSKDLALFYSNLGCFYNSLEELDKAETYLKTALEMYLKYCGKQSEEVAAAYGNLADLYGKTNPELSLQYVKKTLDFYVEMYGEHHPNVAWCYGTLAAVYYNKGEEDLAEEYDKRALSIYKDFYGETHPRIALIYHLISTKLLEKGKITQATEYNQKALEINRSVYGEYHSTVASCYNFMGSISVAQDKPQEASEFVDKAVKIMEQKYPEGHPDLYLYYLAQGTYRLGQQSHDAANFSKNRTLDGQFNDYGAEDSFNKLLATAEKFYLDNAEKMGNAITYLVHEYFIRIALGGEEYKKKLQALSAKYPRYVKPALDGMIKTMGKQNGNTNNNNN